MTTTPLVSIQTQHDTETILKSDIAYESTAVFSKSYCPYCKATKNLLRELGAKAYIIELDEVGQ